MPFWPTIASQGLAVPVVTSIRHWAFSTRDCVLAPFHQGVVLPALKFPLTMSSVSASVWLADSVGDSSPVREPGSWIQAETRADASVSAAARNGRKVVRREFMETCLSGFKV